MSIRMTYLVCVFGYGYTFARSAAMSRCVLLLLSPVFDLLFSCICFFVCLSFEMRFHVHQDSCLAGWVMGYTVISVFFFRIIPSAVLFPYSRIPLSRRLSFNALVFFVL